MGLYQVSLDLSRPSLYLCLFDGFYLDSSLYMEVNTYTEVKHGKLIVRGPNGKRAVAEVNSEPCPHSELTIWRGRHKCQHCHVIFKVPPYCIRGQHVDGGIEDAATCVCGKLDYSAMAARVCRHETTVPCELRGKDALICRDCAQYLDPETHNTPIQFKQAERQPSGPELAIDPETHRYSAVLQIIGDFHVKAASSKGKTVLRAKVGRSRTTLFEAFMAAVRLACRNEGSKCELDVAVLS